MNLSLMNSIYKLNKKPTLPPMSRILTEKLPQAMPPKPIANVTNSITSIWLVLTTIQIINMACMTNPTQANIFLTNE